MSTISLRPKNSVILRVSGADAKRYLQGRITQDVNSLQELEPKKSLILTPNGKILGKFLISKLHEDYAIISDPLSEKQKEEFIRNILLFKVADQLEIIEEKTLPEDIKVALIDSNKFEKSRIIEGEPLFSSELAQAQAPDIPLDNYASFNKGCYAGQEVVEMAIARGKPNKRLFHFEAKGIVGLSPQDQILVNENAAGTITSITTLPEENKTIGLGFVKNKFEFSENFNANDIALCEIKKN